MIKYFIIEYEKQPQSFLASINTMDFHNKGNIQEPYILKLRKRWFGLFNTTETIIIHLPKGFDASKELVKGRQYIK